MSMYYTTRYTIRRDGPHEVSVHWAGNEDCPPCFRDDSITAATLARKLRRDIDDHLAQPGATLGNYQF